jgi:hypothetical protein
MLAALRCDVRRRSLVLPTCTALALSGYGSLEHATATRGRLDVADIAVVHLSEQRLHDIPSWTSGLLFARTDRDSLGLWSTATAAFLPDSSLLVDSGPDLISFSEGGGIAHRLGREGDGPGEYHTIVRLGVAEDGTIFVADLGERITHIHPSGEVVRIVPRLQPGPDGQEVDPVALLDSGQMVATWWQQRPNRGTMVGLAEGGIERDPARSSCSIRLVGQSIHWANGADRNVREYHWTGNPPAFRFRSPDRSLTTLGERRSPSG